MYNRQYIYQTIINIYISNNNKYIYQTIINIHIKKALRTLTRENKQLQKTKAKKKNNLEIKDRRYYLKNDLSPLTFTLAAKHSSRHPLMYFDESLGQERELRYVTNKPSPLFNEHLVPFTLNHIVFKIALFMFPNQQQIQKKLL